MSKRKEHRLTIQRVRLEAPRALETIDAASVTGCAYPRAAELAASSAWTEWLQGALRAVLLPAGVAGAMSLAACGLASGSDVEPDPTTPLVPGATTPGHTGATLPTPHPVPLGGAPAVVVPAPPIAPHPDPIRTPGEAPPVLAQPPTPPAPPPIPPPTNPPHIRGRVASTGTE